MISAAGGFVLRKDLSRSSLRALLLADAQISGGLPVAGGLPGATVIGELVAASGETTVLVR